MGYGIYSAVFRRLWLHVEEAMQHRKSCRRPKGRKIREECIAGFSIHSCMNEISYRIHNNYVSKCICPYGVR